MKRHLHPPLVSLRRLMLTACMLALILLSWGSLLAYHVCPQHTVFFQWLGLIVPVFIGINLTLLILGVFRSRLLFIGAAIALMGCAHYIPKVIQFPKKTPGLTADLRVATFNVRGFRMDYNLPSAALIAEFVDVHQIDAICLQEVPTNYTVSTLKSAFPDMPYQVLTSATTGQHKLAILSKYPILRSETVSFPERPHCALIADLMVQEQPLRVFNYHLQTTNLNQIRGEAGLILANSHDRRYPISILSRNFMYRGDQALQLSKIASKSPYPTVLCGDLNDSPVSYVYHTMLGDMKDAFCEAGQGYSYTYRYFMKLLRIDFVFFSDQLRALDYRTLNLPYSDHLPIIVDLKLTTSRGHPVGVSNNRVTDFFD